MLFGLEPPQKHFTQRTKSCTLDWNPPQKHFTQRTKSCTLDWNPPKSTLHKEPNHALWTGTPPKALYTKNQIMHFDTELKQRLYYAHSSVQHCCTHPIQHNSTFCTLQVAGLGWSTSPSLVQTTDKTLKTPGAISTLAPTLRRCEARDPIDPPGYSILSRFQYSHNKNCLLNVPRKSVTVLALLSSTNSITRELPSQSCGGFHCVLACYYYRSWANLDFDSE